MPNAKWNWLNLKIVSFYTRVGAGASFAKAKVGGQSDKSTLFAFQVSPVGVEVGDASRLMPKPVSAPRAVCWSVRVTASDRLRHEKPASVGCRLFRCGQAFAYACTGSFSAITQRVVPKRLRLRCPAMNASAFWAFTELPASSSGERTPPRPSRPARRP